MERPDWCPHKDCIFQTHSQSCMCVGKLQYPTKHDGGWNTHRLCLYVPPDTKAFDIQLNQGDAWNMMRLLKLIKKDNR